MAGNKQSIWEKKKTEETWKDGKKILGHDQRAPRQREGKRRSLYLY